jgi:hypothetical protein
LIEVAMRIESKVGDVVAGEEKPTPTATEPEPATPDSEAGAPDQRTRLEKIRAAIKQDRYPVDLDELASKMVDHEFVIRSGTKLS